MKVYDCPRCGWPTTAAGECDGCRDEDRRREDGRCEGCGVLFKGRRGLAAHQSKKFISMHCRRYL